MRRILVVEDDPKVAELIQVTLEEEDLEIEVVGDGLSALDSLARFQPDLILADIAMPRMSGYQLYQRVRRNPEWVRIPFIFLTGRKDPEDIRFAIEMGADGYLTKPFEPQDLVAAVWGRLARFEELITDRPWSQEKPTGQYQVGDLMIDLSRHQVIVEGQEVELSATEFGIMQRLIVANGAVVLYEDLMGYEEDELLGERDAAELLRYHIRSIRQKLKGAGVEDDVIINVRGVGYRLAEEPLLLP